MDKVVHFEIPVDDMGRAKKFYKSIFGWKLVDFPMQGGMVYTMATTVEVDKKQMPKEKGAINGGLMRRSAKISAPVLAINVSSVDRSIKKVEAAGGMVVEPKIEIPNMGYYAYVKDCEGNVIGLWENIKKPAAKSKTKKKK